MYTFKFVLETSEYNNLVKYDIYMRYRKFPLNADFKGLFLGFHANMGCELEIAKPGGVLCQKGGAVVSQLVTKLKESAPLPRGPILVLSPPPPPPSSGCGRGILYYYYCDNIGGGGWIGGSPCRMSIKRNGNVALSNLRKPHMSPCRF